MLPIIAENGSFVAPHYISELGEEGLTLHEIAQSLGIEFKEAKRVLEKNINDYMTVEISTVVNRGFMGQQETSSYALTTEDAKFFVAGYNNDIGKSYRRYLIRYEKAHQSLKSQPKLSRYPEAKEVLESMLDMCDILGVPKHYAQIETVKEVRKTTGVDLGEVLKLASAQDNIKDEEVMLEPKELAAELGMDSPQQVNKWLQALGFQTKTDEGWKPTKQGEPWCAKHSWTKGSKSGYNLKWNLKHLKEELDNSPEDM